MESGEWRAESGERRVESGERRAERVYFNETKLSNSIKKQMNSYSRRRFLGITAAALALVPVTVASGVAPKRSKTRKPDSKFGGVQVGAITYSWRSMPGTAEDTLKYCLLCGISSIELMGNTAELYAGLPQAPARPARALFPLECQ